MRAFDWNNLNLQSDPYRVTATNVFDAPQIDITSADPTRADGVIHLYRKLRGREIDVSGLIRAASELDADYALDTLKKKILTYRGKGELGVSIGGKRRFWTGIIGNQTIGRKNTDVSRMTYSFQLSTEKPYALDEDGSVSFAPATVVTSPYATLGTQNDGTYLAAPEITIQVGTVPGGTATADFTIKNPETNEEITFTATVKNGDTLFINTDKRRIFQNSTEIYGVGVFPEWLPEGGLLDYADTLASRSVTVSATYMRKWL